MTMTSYLLIEDEHFARDEVKRIMQRIRPGYRLAGEAESVEEAVALLRGGSPDLLLADICLADGLCFEIFEELKLEIPVIFTTAYDEYAIKAFKLNSIDYLLKPVDAGELERALEKFERRALPTSLSPQLEKLKADIFRAHRKNRFLVQTGDRFEHVYTKDTAFFYSEDKYVWLHTFDGRRHIIGYSLEQLEDMLDPAMFFRLSRNCIANIASISGSAKWFGGRILPEFRPECPLKVVVSRKRADDYLKWLDGLS